MDSWIIESVIPTGGWTVLVQLRYITRCPDAQRQNAGQVRGVTWPLKDGICYFVMWQIPSFIVKVTIWCGTRNAARWHAHFKHLEASWNCEPASYFCLGVLMADAIHKHQIKIFLVFLQGAILLCCRRYVAILFHSVGLLPNTRKNKDILVLYVILETLRYVSLALSPKWSCHHTFARCYSLPSEESVFGRQNLTSIDVRFWRPKTKKELKIIMTVGKSWLRKLQLLVCMV